MVFRTVMVLQPSLVCSASAVAPATPEAITAAMGGSKDSCAAAARSRCNVSAKYEGNHASIT